jgi:hypothetical protein
MIRQAIALIIAIIFAIFVLALAVASTRIHSYHKPPVEDEEEGDDYE